MIEPSNILNIQSIARSPLEQMVVITHANCMDGLGSLLAYATAATAPYSVIELNYSDVENDSRYLADLYDALVNRTVLMTDFSLKRPALVEVCKRAKFVEIIDHHLTAESELEGFGSSNLRVTFDKAHSGATLTWLRFHPDAPIPELLCYIEDRDLWTWKMDNSKAISEALKHYVDPCDSRREALRVLHNILTEVPLDDLTKSGLILSEAASSAARAAARKLTRFEWNGKVGMVGNATSLISETGYEALKLEKSAEFSATYFFKSDAPLMIVSFRSRKEGLNVSELAQSLGGGGHMNAAGATIDIRKPTEAQKTFLAAIGW